MEREKKAQLPVPFLRLKYIPYFILFSLSSSSLLLLAIKKIMKESSVAPPSAYTHHGIGFLVDSS